MKTPEKIIDTYSKALKNNVGLSLSIDECEEFVHSVVTECDIMNQDSFTKEQVIELMREAYIDGVSEGVNIGSDDFLGKPIGFNDWLEKEKPFDAK